MKTMILGVLAIAALPAAASAAPVRLDLSGIRAARGDLYVSLQTRAQFMQPTGSYGTIVRKPAAGSRVVTLEGVAPGDYSVSVWHDINANGKWDSDERGVPLDGWAMVNGDALRAKPTFEQVSFAVGTDPKVLKLNMRYGR